LEAFDEALAALASWTETHAVDEPLRLLSARASQLREDLGRVKEPATHEIAWVEARERAVSAGVSPVEVGGLFRREVVDRVGGVVLTSATLTTGERGKFAFLRSRLGLHDETLTAELEVPSPFDHAEASLLYVPRDLPEVSDASFPSRSLERATELITLAGGGAFVLCTSVRSMKSFALGLRRQQRGSGSEVLVQGEAPKMKLLERFKADGHAILVATMSFWEGVDVPGQALRLVILDKIPFAVPTDPIVQARQAALEAAGQPAFARYALPQAAITLKQGFGRLLRTRADRGVVAILDRRLLTKSYGRVLLGSLPPARRTSELEDVRAFWAQLARARG
jgi:ATP-dependent DNA helicase DinG